MQSKAATVEQYLAELPDDRRAAIEAVRKVILKNLGKGYQEAMQYGMIGYSVPHSVYPAGYHCDPRQPVPFASIGSQKNHMSLYLMCLYNDPEQLAWFEETWAATGKKLDMGKGCVRFRTLEDVPLDVVGTLIKRVPVRDFIANYEGSLAAAKHRPRSKKAPVAQKPAKKAAKQPAATGTKKKSTPRPAATPARKAAPKKAAPKKAANKPAAKRPGKPQA